MLQVVSFALLCSTCSAEHLPSANSPGGVELHQASQCNVPNQNFVGDGRCDSAEYNSPECLWDGGDCCEETCLSSTFVCGSSGYNCTNPHATCGCPHHTFQAGDRVVAIADIVASSAANLTGTVTLPRAGDLGTVICEADSTGTTSAHRSIFVSWDNFVGGHNGNGNCDCLDFQPILSLIPADSGYFVQCSEIDFAPPSPAPTIAPTPLGQTAAPTPEPFPATCGCPLHNYKAGNRVNLTTDVQLDLGWAIYGPPLYSLGTIICEASELAWQSPLLVRWDNFFGGNADLINRCACLQYDDLLYTVGSAGWTVKCDEITLLPSPAPTPVPTPQVTASPVAPPPSQGDCKCGAEIGAATASLEATFEARISALEVSLEGRIDALLGEIAALMNTSNTST